MRALTSLVALWAAPALADAPPVPLAPVSMTCATDGPACATVDRRAGTLTVRRGRAGPVLWQVHAAPPVATPSGDGRFVFEEYRQGGVVNLTDGPDTSLLAVRDRGRMTRTLRLRDITDKIQSLPTSASHRDWSVVRYFDREDQVVIDLADGRELRIEPVSGAVAFATARGDGRPAYCRFAQAPTAGPCARRR